MRGGEMVRGGPAHHTVWADDSPGDVIDGLRSVIAGGLVKEREALLQDKAAAGRSPPVFDHIPPT